MDLSKTIFYHPIDSEFEDDFEFCGDDLYGHYTKDELLKLRSAIWWRITAVITHHFRYGED